jgi:hypothetical protein
METQTIASLIGRLEQLEGENRRLKRRTRFLERSGLLVALVGASVLLVGAALPDEKAKTVEAERFVIKGEDGKIYGQLGLYRSGDGSISGAANLAFFDDSGAIRTNYGVGSRHDPYLHFMDDKGIHRGNVGVSDGRMVLGFVDPSGMTGVSIGAGENGSGLSLLRSDGKNAGQRQVGSLVVDTGGESALNFFRPVTVAKAGEEFARVNLGMMADGTGRLSLRGQDFESGIRANVTTEGRSRLTIDRHDLR